MSPRTLSSASATLPEGEGDSLASGGNGTEAGKADDKGIDEGTDVAAAEEDDGAEGPAPESSCDVSSSWTPAETIKMKI